ncbi:MAG: adenylate/guanylate cyclase domain-containing protein [Spirochaetota bacterium]
MINKLLTHLQPILLPGFLGIPIYAIYKLLTNFSFAFFITSLAIVPYTVYSLYTGIKKIRVNHYYEKYLIIFCISLLAYPIIGYIESQEALQLEAISIITIHAFLFILNIYALPYIHRNNLEFSLGDTFPDIAINNHLEEKIQTKDLLDLPCLFIFFRGNWCPFCMTQIKELAELYKEIELMGVRIVLISPQSLTQTQELAEKFQINATYLADTDFRLTDNLGIRHKSAVPFVKTAQYGVDSIFPTVIITDEKGKIIFADKTDSYRIRPEPATYMKVFKQHKVHSKLQKQIEETTKEAIYERKRSDNLLKNILPDPIAEELKNSGKVKPIHYDCVTVLFTDFKGFTSIAEKLSPTDLLAELDYCFSNFDKIITKHKLEKMKTIGDSYMCAGGIPTSNRTHAIDCVLAALAIQQFMKNHEREKKFRNESYWQIRLGIHSGGLVAGVIGDKKFAYDIWGDTVNTASRMESSGIAGEVNISQETYSLIKDFFTCEYRGRISAKNKDNLEMYLVKNIRKDFIKSVDDPDPNEDFWKKYNEIQLQDSRQK